MGRNKKTVVKQNPRTVEVKDELNDLMNMRVRELLLCEPESMKKEIFYMKLDQAKLGMAYIRDREVMKRISSSQTLRVVNLISSNAVERQRYIKASMPELSVVQMIEGE